MQAEQLTMNLLSFATGAAATLPVGIAGGATYAALKDSGSKIPASPPASNDSPLAAM